MGLLEKGVDRTKSPMTKVCQYALTPAPATLESAQWLVANTPNAVSQII